ncbi:polysaccharide deacetylase family protein [Herbaspirillum sp. RTI4]|uniref:polysaccharide deacetylase family protein n=1 Tax=Herbaspirillum sp. RTI4 TaxID=3048640 RepID=UPI002AB4590A|nr:polysaccharide deacetylase family protein [Herbaspirillum sp. RTI4]MDY7578259.1 polysaccharide deacetylase family protein [Herbaspirillum sp. RTI4]MEA9981248.1 polysaccharide deacetylase family protein [Herbaspirillum sp. RTI4]
MNNPMTRPLTRWLARQLVRNQLPLRGDTAVVSFTFDDVPASACTNGAHTLEQHGVRGTFYIAGDLTDRLEQGIPCHSLAQLKLLKESGHEIGSHGFSHIHYDTLNDARLKLDLQRNSDFLDQLSIDPAWLNFAYPFGAYSLEAKLTCRKRFRSSRISGGGHHEKSADLNALKTYRLYSTPVDAGSYESHLKRTVATKGWLIINTHDVQASPSRYGCTPERLNTAVAAALAAGCKVLPVDAAIDYWESQS